MNIAALIGIMIGIIVGVSLISTTASSITTKNGYSSSAVAMVHILPIIFVAIGILMALKVLTRNNKTSPTVIKLWDDFGERLKTAYTAKFGGENPAFNTEVDNNILICKTMSKNINSDMKKSSELRLKNYAHMCDIPFVIPEEEHLSEEEKTKEFGNKNDGSKVFQDSKHEYSDNDPKYKDNKKGVSY